MYANTEGAGETARMRRLAWAFAGRLCDKYYNLMSWLIWTWKKICLLGENVHLIKTKVGSTQNKACQKKFWNINAAKILPLTSSKNSKWLNLVRTP